MKIKAILFALALTAVTAFGQGKVHFQNSTALGTGVFLNDGTTMMPAGGNAFSFYFTYGTSAGTLDHTSATFFNHASSAGRIAGSTSIALDSGFPTGTTTFFKLYAYSTSAGSFANAKTAAGAYWYESSVITSAPADPLSPTGTQLFGTTPGSTFQGFNFNFNPVPEPSTYALGALGLGALALIRRRK